MNEEEPPSIRERLAKEIGTCLSQDLRAHLTRGVVRLVAPTLELLEVAVAVAEDDAPRVQRWIAAGDLASPTLEQVEAWDRTPEARFRMAIVRPFVLVQTLNGA